MDTIVVTASAGAFSGLADALRDLSVRVVDRPLLSFGPPTDWAPLDEALRLRARYGSVALSSPRAAAALADRIRAGRISWLIGHDPRVWAVGAATADALQGLAGPVQGSFPETSLDESAAARLAHSMVSAGAAGPVLFPCGEMRREDLPDVLRSRGIEVHEVVCYRTILATPEQARSALTEARLLVVASPSVVQLLVESSSPGGRPALLAIGPTTAAAARAAGWEPAAVPPAPSTPALASAITGLLSPR
jgi:uroporphyrinogen-III synthase